jgi:hypothetical protein
MKRRGILEDTSLAVEGLVDELLLQTWWGDNALACDKEGFQNDTLNTTGTAKDLRKESYVAKHFLDP